MIEIPYDVFSRIMRMATRFALKDDTRPTLKYIEIKRANKPNDSERYDVVFSALDGFRAVVATAEGNKVDNQDEFTAYILPAQFLKGKYSRVQITSSALVYFSDEYGKVEMQLADREQRKVDLNKLYVNLDEFSGGAKRIAVQAQYMLDIASGLEGTEAFVEIYMPEASHCPLRILAKDSDRSIKYDFLLMPVRVVDWDNNNGKVG